MVGAGRAGQALGASLLGLGVFQLLRGGTPGVWTVMIGWFVLAGAGYEVGVARDELRRQGGGGLPSVVPGLPWPPPHDRHRTGS